MRFKLLLAIIALFVYSASFAQKWEDLNNQVLSYLGKGDYPNALMTALKAKEVAQQEFGENHADYSASLHNLASAHKKLGEFTPAEALYWEALKIDKKVLGVRHQNYALSLFGLANLYKLKKEFSKAESIYQDALEIMEKAVTNRHPDYALILGDFADLQTQLGHYKKAENNLRRARNTTKYSVGDEHQDYATILFYYGKLFKTKGNINKAENSLKEALGLFKNTVGVHHPDYKDCERYLNNLYDPQFELYKAAPTEIVFKQDNGDGGGTNGTGTKKYVRPDAADFEALTKEDMEINLDEYDPNLDAPEETVVEQPKTMEPQGTQITEITEPPVIKSEPAPATNIQTWTAYSIEMDKHTQRGRYNEAILAGEKAIDLVRAEFGEKHENYSWISLKLADSYENAGMLDKAIPLYEQDLENIEANLGRDNTTYRKRRDILLDAYEKTGQKHKARDFYKKSIYASFAKFNSVSLVEQNRMMEKMQKETAEYYTQSMDMGFLVSGTEMQNLYLALKGRDTDAALGIDFPLNGNIEDYQKRLREKLQANEAAIDFFRMTNPNTQEGNYFALVTRKNQEETVMVPLLDERKIDVLLNEPANDPDSYVQNEDRSYHLYQLIWEPLEPHLKGVNFVHVSTDGALNKVSFSGLMDLQKNNLVDKYEIYYYCSLRDFLTEQKSYDKNDEVHFFGGVDYGGGADGKLNYMPATRDEVNTFKVVCAAKGWDVDTKVAGEASEANLKTLSGERAPGVLHLATPVYYQHLEEYSGIALSNANAKITATQFSDDANDGLLNAIEISHLDLSSTNMVILSASETGADKNSDKGILSIQRALKSAGVGTILFSQWKVPDKQAQELLALFYINHLSGMDIHKAFYTAQKDIRKLYKSPYYWAGFILIE